jgi:hypothetical protein
MKAIMISVLGPLRCIDWFQGDVEVRYLLTYLYTYRTYGQ